MTTASPISCGCERSRISEPTGLASCHLNGARFSGGSDSGRMKQAVEGVGEAQAGRDPERQARIEAAGNAAERRPEHEAGAEGDAEHAEKPPRAAPAR